MSPQPQGTRNEALRLEGVRFAYDEGRPVLENVHVVLPAAGLFAMIGPNGGGKSTLLKVVLGLLHPQAGRVEVLGRRPEAARTRVGYLAQHATLDPSFPISVREVVRMGRINARGRKRREDAAAIEGALAEVGLEGFATRAFNGLSGGERQRVLIARALVASPELLLLDEPLSHADPVAEERFFRLLKRLAERMTIVVVSHDLGFVSHHVETVVCVNRKVVSHPTEALDAEALSGIWGDNVALVRHDHRHEVAPESAAGGSSPEPRGGSAEEERRASGGGRQG